MKNDGFEAERIYAATFIVEVDGVEIGRFMEVTGLQVDIAVEEVQEVGRTATPTSCPAR
jgi:hypothetical protein